MAVPSTDRVLQTRDQRYAATVYARVRPIEEKEKTYHNAYGGMAHTLPVLIHTAGLAQALSFVEARGQEAHKALLADLAAVLGLGDATALLKRSREAGLRDYMRLTHEALAALIWFKRFAQSLLDVDAADDQEGRP